ncbi:hypothetical protein INS49_009218 [Diaporthe citri]|uniref:uncharacterized protein n=1 Tax=Diaporthe citri TaxID=83186 RepID=UPI001C7EC2A1|nr:uncharacterized protein INS49_009218 [Diaporthe citri]KAG6360999.1 hypothetical protein INS49_009218 [Diaporthe citri]
MSPQDGPEDEFIKICLPTHLAEEERTAYFGKFRDNVEDDLNWVKPQFIEWPPEQGEGSIEGGDLLRLFKQAASADPEGAELQYFAGRQSTDSGTVILAHRDPDITELAAESGITLPEGWARMDRVVEELMDELTDRGVARGRIPVSKWRPSWCNADIGNMHEHEFIECCGRSNSILRDPERDWKQLLRESEGGGRKNGSTTSLSL